MKLSPGVCFTELSVIEVTLRQWLAITARVKMGNPKNRNDTSEQAQGHGWPTIN
mgnify:CR=1 FL=1